MGTENFRFFRYVRACDYVVFALLVLENLWRNCKCVCVCAFKRTETIGVYLIQLRLRRGRKFPERTFCFLLVA